MVWTISSVQYKVSASDQRLCLGLFVLCSPKFSKLQVQHAMAASSATNYQNTPLLSKFDVKSLDALSLLKHQNLLVAVAWPVSSDLFQMEH